MLVGCVLSLAGIVATLFLTSLGGDASLAKLVILGGVSAATLIFLFVVIVFRKGV